MLTLIFTSANLKLNKFQAEFNISMELNLQLKLKCQILILN